MEKNFEIRLNQTIAGRHFQEKGIIVAISSKEAYDKTVKLISHKASIVRITIKKV